MSDRAVIELIIDECIQKAYHQGYTDGVEDEVSLDLCTPCFEAMNEGFQNYRLQIENEMFEGLNNDLS
jgi:hypothetical protein